MLVEVKALRQRRGSVEGGWLRLGAMQRHLYYCLARPATSEQGAADLSRLGRVPAAEVETPSCGCVGSAQRAGLRRKLDAGGCGVVVFGKVEMCVRAVAMTDLRLPSDSVT